MPYSCRLATSTHSRRLGALAGHLQQKYCDHPRQAGVGAAARDETAAHAQAGELPIQGWPEGLPMYDFVEVPRFDAGDPAALAHVNEHGYAVISVLSQHECDTALDKIWRHIEGAGRGVLRDDPSTWVDEAWQASVPPTHAEALWYVRGIPKVPLNPTIIRFS